MTYREEQERNGQKRSTWKEIEDVYVHKFFINLTDKEEDEELGGLLPFLLLFGMYSRNLLCHPFSFQDDDMRYRETQEWLDEIDQHE